MDRVELDWIRLDWTGLDWTWANCVGDFDVLVALNVDSRRIKAGRVGASPHPSPLSSTSGDLIVTN